MIRTVVLMLSLLDTSIHARSQSAHDWLSWGVEQRRPYPAVHWFSVSAYREAVELRWKFGASKGPDRDRFDAGGPTRFRWWISPPASLPMPQSPPTPFNRLGFVFERDWEEDERGNVSAFVTVALPHGLLNVLTGVGLPLGLRN